MTVVAPGCAARPSVSTAGKGNRRRRGGAGGGAGHPRTGMHSTSSLPRIKKNHVNENYIDVTVMAGHAETIYQITAAIGIGKTAWMNPTGI